MEKITQSLNSSYSEMDEKGKTIKRERRLSVNLKGGMTSTNVATTNPTKKTSFLDKLKVLNEE